MSRAEGLAADESSKRLVRRRVSFRRRHPPSPGVPQAVATVLAERAKELGMTQVTFDRFHHRLGPGEHGKVTYVPGTKVAIVLDTLRKKGFA